MPTDKRLRDDAPRDLGDAPIADTVKTLPAGAVSGILTDGSVDVYEVPLGFSDLPRPTVNSVSADDEGEIEVDCESVTGAVDVYVFDAAGRTELARSENEADGTVTVNGLEPGADVLVFVRATDGLNTSPFADGEEGTVGGVEPPPPPPEEDEN